MLSTRPIAAGSIPITSTLLNFPSFVVQNLEEIGIEHLFPAQAEVVPFLMREGYDHDVCVMSPTGTGKTLAYAIPIVKRLHRRVIPRIRALVVLPSHDLAMQVKNVFDYLVKNTELKVCAIGDKRLSEEQSTVNDADIIIATPGRLQSHIDSNEKFTLQHLEFLVLDEADKLLSHFAPWLYAIFPAIYNEKQGSLDVPLSGTVTVTQVNIATIRVSHLHPTAFENSPPLRRWLFSATLTSQSAQIARLHLHCPMFFTAIREDSLKKYQFPKNLLYYILVPGDMKGVALVTLINEIIANKFASPSARESGRGAKIACFAQSVDACHRLYTILKLMQPQLTIQEFYSSLGDAERARVLHNFEKGHGHGHASIVVCSDLMARGLDISAIDAIINYDVPEHIKAYVHRVGRTARGIHTGVAYSIIDAMEKEKFLQMVQKGDNLNIAEKIYKYNDELINQLKDVLPKLQSKMKEEASLERQITRKK